MIYVKKLRELGIIPKVIVVFIVLTLGLISFSESAYADTDVLDCQILNTPGETYNQVNNIETDSDCIQITADNITYNGNNFSIKPYISSPMSFLLD